MVNPMILECNHLVKSFGSFTVISDLSFNMEEGTIFGLVGPNGSGKTTLFNLISKVLPLNSGEIKFKGQRIDKLKPHQICHLGVARTFQIPAFFATMPVWEQVMVGAVFGNRKAADAEKNVLKALEFVNLRDRAEVPARMLDTFGKKRLMIATALATEPKLLLLDEPLGGLQGPEISETLDLVKKIRESGMTVMIIEHNMRAVMSIAEKVLVLHHGEKIAEGSPNDVTKDPQVIKVYLGEEYI